LSSRLSRETEKGMARGTLLGSGTVPIVRV
jgi:hypothetical protein